jgi:hypothetical protein
MQSILQQCQDSIALSIFGRTLKDALSTQTCIRCKSPVDSTDWEQIDLDEFQISGLCPTCFAACTAFDAEKD